MTSRYLISHPVINKESYFDTDKVKAALIPLDGDITILNESVDKIIDFTFSDSSLLYSLPLNPYCTFVLSISSTTSETDINLLASRLYRLHTSSYKRVLYGNVILFGSQDPLDPYSKHQYHSLPYEMIEQLYLLAKQR